MKWIEPKKYLNKLKLDEFPQPEIIDLNYPVLLCHGYGSMSMLMKPSPMHDSCMRLRGFGIHAFAPNIVPYAAIEIRAGQWEDRIKKLQKKYGYDKFNVIAHSMGGLDMRYAIHHSNLSEKVASLTTIATPHYGTSLAEIVLTTPELLKEKLNEMMNWFGENVFPNEKSNAREAVEQLTRDYVQSTFNPSTPNHKNVKYFSVSAAVGKGTDHPLNPILRLQNQLIYQKEGTNDSFVTAESAVWGEHIGQYPISHLEQIDIQVSRERRPLVDSMWMDIANNLKKNGL
ncbi:lipase family alpha/beta hydrolase [Rhodohalobacter halophilus]|uniref:lipase family alpha/beta hydrolase n=1 Tax=Rhodohalobacter halophilus TaxID=1812810 RepID=UPI00083F572E|nr:alpha/beta fold hydrolase [Rhodohalobacter halophilus]